MGRAYAGVFFPAAVAKLCTDQLQAWNLRLAISQSFGSELQLDSSNVQGRLLT